MEDEVEYNDSLKKDLAATGLRNLVKGWEGKSVSPSIILAVLMRGWIEYYRDICRGRFDNHESFIEDCHDKLSKELKP